MRLIVAVDSAATALLLSTTTASDAVAPAAVEPEAGAEAEAAKSVTEAEAGAEAAKSVAEAVEAT